MFLSFKEHSSLYQSSLVTQNDEIQLLNSFMKQFICKQASKHLKISNHVRSRGDPEDKTV